MYQDLDIEREEEELAESSDKELAGSSDKTAIVISLKNNNQGSIALAHNPVFHSRTKHVNIQHHSIYDKVGPKRIELSYVLTEEIVVDGLMKALTHVKFHSFIEQIRMT